MKRKSTITHIKPGTPGHITYNNSELVATVTDAEISKYGHVYVDRNLVGCEVVVFVLRKAGRPGGLNELP